MFAPVSDPARTSSVWARNNQPPIFIPKPRAAERPVLRGAAQFRFHWIALDVADCFLLLFVIAHERVPILAFPTERLERRSPTRRVGVVSRSAPGRRPALRQIRL